MQELSERRFEKFRELVFKRTGVHIEESKKVQLELKIRKAMIMSKINNIDDYLKILIQDQDNNVLQEFINTVTTNTTEFFRERAF